MVRNTVTKNVRHVVPQLRSKYYKRDASLLIQAGTQRGSVLAQVVEPVSYKRLIP